MRSKRQVSLREFEMKTVRTKTTGTMHPFDLWFYPALHSHYYPPSLHRQHITDKGTFGIALAAPLFLFVQSLSISTVGKEETLGIVLASSLFLQGARQHA